MDEDEKRYWNDVLEKLNAKLDDILDKLAADRALPLSQRITRLEEPKRKGQP